MHDNLHHQHQHDDSMTAFPDSIQPLARHNMHGALQIWTSSPLIFYSWSLGTAHGLGSAVAVSAILSVMYEGSKFYYHITKILYHRPPNRWQGTLVAHYVSRMWKALAYMLHFLIGYILMLLSMTFNLWILVAICLGAGIGYFFVLPLLQRVLHRNYGPSARAAHAQQAAAICSHSLDAVTASVSPELDQSQQHSHGDDVEHVQMATVEAVDVHVDSYM